MTTVADPSRRPENEGDTRIEIRVSAYDQVAGLIISLLILTGSAVVIMFILWLSATLVFTQRAVPVRLVEDASGRGDHAAGFERDLEAPGMEEAPELVEPQLDVKLEALSEAVSEVAAASDVLDTPSEITGRGEGGLGDSRPPGPLGEGEDLIPRWQRWEIRWTTMGLSGYARQLDFFHIELGVAGSLPNIDYAYNLSKPRPDRRSGPPDKEQRLYMTWRSGTLEALDRTLLSRAGIQTEGRLVLQFYPQAVEDQLAWMEMENGRGRKVREFLRTVFGVRPASDGFEFHILEQRFRPAPP